MDYTRPEVRRATTAQLHNFAPEFDIKTKKNNNKEKPKYHLII